MNNSLEWVTELAKSHARLEARNVLKLAQAVATIFDGSAWSDMQSSLLDQIHATDSNNS